jgi:hypothetical protein
MPAADLISAYAELRFNSFSVAREQKTGSFGGDKQTRLPSRASFSSKP